MSKILNQEFIERLLFTVIVIGILGTLVGAVRYFDLSNQIANNTAAQVREEGGEVTLETKNEARGLMAADLELRRLIRDRQNMMVVGGGGLALIGLGWLASDIMRGRRRKNQVDDIASQTVAEVLS